MKNLMDEMKVNVELQVDLMVDVSFYALPL